jgi:hypothetical protein
MIFCLLSSPIRWLKNTISRNSFAILLSLSSLNNHSTSKSSQAPKTHPISEATMRPSARKKPLRKNVVLLVSLLGMITYSLVWSSYSSMLALAPESQLAFAGVFVVDNVSDQIQTKSFSPNKDNDNKRLLATTEAHVLTAPKTTSLVAHAVENNVVAVAVAAVPVPVALNVSDSYSSMLVYVPERQSAPKTTPNSTALVLNKIKSRNAQSQSSATTDAHMTMTLKTTVAIAATSKVLVFNKTMQSRNANYQSSVPRKVHANHSHAAITATLSQTKAETNKTLSQSKEKPKSHAGDSLAELDSLSTSTTGTDTAKAIEKVDGLPKVKGVGRPSSLEQPNTEIIAKETAPKRISVEDSLAKLAKAIKKVDDPPKVKSVMRLSSLKQRNTKIIAKETAPKPISVKDSLVKLDSLPTSATGTDTAKAIKKVDDPPKVKSVGRLSSLKQPNTKIIAKETAPKPISVKDSLVKLDSLPTSTTGTDTSTAIDKVDDLPEMKSVGRPSSLEQPNTEIIAKETAPKPISVTDSLAKLDSLSTSTTGADTAKAIDKVDDLPEMKSVGRPSSRPNESLLAKLETSKRYIPERQCSSREYSVPFPFGGCNVTAATSSNSVGSAESCGLCGQNKFVRFLTEVREHLKEKKGKECSKLAIFGVAFGKRNYGSMMMKDKKVVKEMNKKHGKCFFTFVLEGDHVDGATQRQKLTQSTYLGIKIPVPITVLPYKNMRRNTKLFKMYGGLLVFSFAERLIWQDAKLDKKLHHTQDYNNYFKEHIDKNGVCAAMLGLPKHFNTLGTRWENDDGPLFKDHCDLLASPGIKRKLPYTDSREAIKMQCDYYHKLNSTSYGSSLDSGLIDSALMAWDMRTERCREFNQRLSCTWLDETQCYGDRDQVSFPQAFRSMELHQPNYVSPAESTTQDKLFVSDDEEQKPLVSAMLLA